MSDAHNTSAGASQPHAGDDAHGPNIGDLPRVPLIAVLGLAVAVLAFFAAIFALGWIPHSRREAATREEAVQTVSAKPVVEVVRPRETPANEDLRLPGDVRPNQATSIFARTNGYLRQLPAGVDIGSKVNAEQVIASIDAPDLDAQLDQARASLTRARASVGVAETAHDLAASTLKRYEDPSLSSAVSRQEIDTRRSQEQSTAAALAEARTSVGVAEAEVKRLEVLQGFKTVVAPFGGVITARNFDAGALISANDAPNGKPLYVLEQTDVLRVHVNLPQAYVSEIEPGAKAALSVVNYPGRTFAGTVARTTGSIDPGTRTLRIEVDVPNASGELLPGMYGQVYFQVRRSKPSVRIPTSALSLGAEGERVAIVEGSRVKLKQVSLGRDFGAEIEIVQGLSTADVIINNPGTLAEGTEVEVRQPKK